MAYATSYEAYYPALKRLPLGYQALERWRAIDLDTSVNTTIRTVATHGICMFDVGEVVSRGFGIVKTTFTSTSSDTIQFSVNDNTSSGNLTAALDADSLVEGIKFDLGLIDIEDTASYFGYNATVALQLEMTVTNHALTAGRAILYVATINLNSLLANG